MGVMKRRTWQREAVRESLMDARGFVSAQELHAQLSSGGSAMGLATVYRALADLVAGDEADVVQSPDGENRYRACVSGGHHHHLICRNCGKTVEIEADAVEEWAKRTAAAHGFTQAHHVVDVFGTCADCSLSLREA